MDVPWVADGDPDVAWVRHRLGDFSTIGGNVPPGFEAYVSVPNSDEGPGEEFSLVGEPFAGSDQDRLQVLLDLLGPATGEQPCCFAVWEGFGGMFRERDGSSAGMALMVAVEDDSGGGWWRRRRRRAEAEQQRRRAEAAYAAALPARPARPHLEVPHRAYYVWRGTLADARRFDGFPWHRSPSLFWPRDRSWFVATDLDSGTTEVGGPRHLLEPLTQEPWGGQWVDPGQPMSSVVS